MGKTEVLSLFQGLGYILEGHGGERVVLINGKRVKT